MRKSTLNRVRKISFLQRIRNFIIEMDLIYYASDAAKCIGMKNGEEMNEELRNAMKVCMSEGIPIEKNFKLIYRCSEKGYVVDYKLSAFAYKLICFSNKPENYFSLSV